MLEPRTAAYVVRYITFDAARPFAVEATFRTFNRIIARYATEAQAKRRARDLNKTSSVPLRLGEALRLVDETIPRPASIFGSAP